MNCIRCSSSCDPWIYYLAPISVNYQPIRPCIPVEGVIAEVRGDEPVALLADLELEELGQVVCECEGEGGGDHGALAAQRLQRVHHGEHPLQVHAHRHAHRGHPGGFGGSALKR